MRTVLYGGKVVAAHGIFDGGVIIEDHRIAEVFERRPAQMPKDAVKIDVNGQYIAPGFIEMHSHGGGGADVMDGAPEGIIRAARTHMLHGTTTYLPTSAACAPREAYRLIDNYRACRDLPDMPHMPGVHLEGSYFSKEQAGAQNPKFIVPPDPNEYLPMLEYAGGDIRRWSAAPELPGGMAFGREMRRRGILASIGHSNATLEQVAEAMQNGYTHVTHLYSGCSIVRRINAYRYAGVVEAAFLFDDLDVEIIADGKHLPPSLLKLIYKIKGYDRIALITDSLSAAGMPPGPVRVGSEESGIRAVIEDGVAFLPDHSAFAGSVATADRLLDTMTRLADVPLSKAVAMMTQIPARMLGIGNERGRIAQGMIADIVVFNGECAVTHVLCEGKIVKG